MSKTVVNIATLNEQCTRVIEFESDQLKSLILEYTLKFIADTYISGRTVLDELTPIQDHFIKYGIDICRFFELNYPSIFHLCFINYKK